MSCSIGKKCNKKTWVEDIFVLFENGDILPTGTMSKNEKLNSITRLILLIFIGMLLFGYNHSLNFLALAIIIILILYFLTVKENYSQMDVPRTYKYPLIEQNRKSMKKLSTPPIIVPRAHDKDVWSFPSYRHSAVNYNSSNYDITEEYTPLPGEENYTEFDPRMESVSNFNLDRVEEYCKNPQMSETNNEDIKYSVNGMDRIPSTQNYQRLQPRPTGVRENFTTPIGSVINNNTSVTPIGSVTPLKYLPSQDLLIPKTITSIYGEGDITNEERIKYLETIEPTQYSYSDMAYPINANLGISYTPDIPPMVLDQVATPNGVYPLYHRLDPQLIRSQGIAPERREELPYRNQWSARYSGFDAAPGTVNFEDIYDPKFTGYGDENRSYGDVNLGQVQYYYSDVDAYRSPNFGIRTKVDHIDYIDPMGKVLPEYSRNVGVNDIKKSVHDQYNSDAMYFREGLQERLMKKRNRELWQLRAMPMSKGSHTSSFTSNY